MDITLEQDDEQIDQFLTEYNQKEEYQHRSESYIISTIIEVPLVLIQWIVNVFQYLYNRIYQPIASYSIELQVTFIEETVKSFFRESYNTSLRIIESIFWSLTELLKGSFGSQKDEKRNVQQNLLDALSQQRNNTTLNAVVEREYSRIRGNNGQEHGSVVGSDYYDDRHTYSTFFRLQSPFLQALVRPIDDLIILILRQIRLFFGLSQPVAKVGISSDTSQNNYQVVPGLNGNNNRVSLNGVQKSRTSLQQTRNSSQQTRISLQKPRRESIGDLIVATAKGSKQRVSVDKQGAQNQGSMGIVDTQYQIKYGGLFSDIYIQVQILIVSFLNGLKRNIRSLFLLPQEQLQFTPKVIRKQDSIDFEEDFDREIELMRRHTADGVSRQSNLTDTFSLNQVELESKRCDKELATTANFIQHAGLPVEIHNVITQDGYVLRMERIPRPDSSNAVFFQHGLFDTSLSWVYGGITGSVAFYAYQSGLDVWLANSRVNPPREHSQGESLGMDYWNFTINELGTLDINAQIQYVYETKQKELLGFVDPQSQNVEQEKQKIREDTLKVLQATQKQPFFMRNASTMASSTPQGRQTRSSMDNSNMGTGLKSKKVQQQLDTLFDQTIPEGDSGIDIKQQQTPFTLNSRASQQNKISFDLRGRRSVSLDADVLSYRNPRDQSKAMEEFSIRSSKEGKSKSMSKARFQKNQQQQNQHEGAQEILIEGVENNDELASAKIKMEEQNDKKNHLIKSHRLLEKQIPDMNVYNPKAARNSLYLFEHQLQNKGENMQDSEITDISGSQTPTEILTPYRTSLKSNVSNRSKVTFKDNDPSLKSSANDIHLNTSAGILNKFNNKPQKLDLTQKLNIIKAQNQKLEQDQQQDLQQNSSLSLDANHVQSENSVQANLLNQHIMDDSSPRQQDIASHPLMGVPTRYSTPTNSARQSENSLHLEEFGGETLKLNKLKMVEQVIKNPSLGNINSLIQSPFHDKDLSNPSESDLTSDESSNYNFHTPSKNGQVDNDKSHVFDRMIDSYSDYQSQKAKNQDLRAQLLSNQQDPLGLKSANRQNNSTLQQQNTQNPAFNKRQAKTGYDVQNGGRDIQTYKLQDELRDVFYDSQSTLDIPTENSQRGINSQVAELETPRSSSWGQSFRNWASYKHRTTVDASRQSRSAQLDERNFNRSSSKSFHLQTQEPYPGQSKVQVNIQGVGHSLGGLSLMMYIVYSRMTNNPHRLSHAILLTPAGFHEFKRLNLVFYLVATLAPPIIFFIRLFWKDFKCGFMVPTEIGRQIILKINQDLMGLRYGKKLVQMGIRFFMNNDTSEWTDAMSMPHYSKTNMPAVSIDEVLHLAQLCRTNQFRMFDYGWRQNLSIYGKTTSPDIGGNYQLVDIPIDISAGSQDGVIPASSVKKHYETLKACKRRVTYKEFDFGHLDFTFTNKVELRQYVNRRLQKYLVKDKNEQ